MALIDSFGAIAQRLNEIQGKPAKTIYAAGKDMILSGAQAGGHSHGFEPAMVVACCNCKRRVTDFVVHKNNGGMPQPWCISCDEDRF
jgi:hypothetical protein